MQAVPTVEEAMRLNPCSTGITFLTKLYNVLFANGADRLNPCSTGITFLTMMLV